MRIWLVLSLVLNGLLIGFIAGDLSRPIDLVRALGTLTDHYPDEIQEDLRARVWADREVLFAELEQMTDLRAELFARMRAPDADRSVLEGLMAEVRTHTTVLQERLQRSTLDAVMAAPPEVRDRIEVPESSIDLETLSAES